MNYTREQSLALCTDRYISVTANAGSGKTRVLVDRYFDILLNGENDLPIDSREVVAITFTRKAASEMLAKVVKRIESEIKLATDSKKLKKLKKIRENLIYAKISTIHSFATSLLRDYPIEAGVLPTFSELSKADEIRLYDNAINEVIERRFEIPEKKEELFELYNTLTRNKVDELIKLCLNEAENLSSIQEFYNQSDDVILFFYTNTIDELIIHDLIQLIANLSIVIDDAIFLIKIKDKDYIKFIDTAKQILALIHIPEISCSNYKDVYNEIAVLTKTKFGSSYFITKAFKLLIVNENFTLKTYKDDFKKIGELIDLVNYEDDLLKSIKTSRIIMDLVLEIYSISSEKKIEAGYLDFNDMILKVDSLLDNEEALAQIKKRMKYILVDEFQDTNPLQYSLIKKLCPKLVNSEIEDDINLFIVGDSKQSIYAFRSADVRVFKEATKNIATVNEHSFANNLINENILLNDKVIESNQIESLGNITLSASFRLSPVVATFVNLVCGSIMAKYTILNNNEVIDNDEDSFDFEVPYSSLVYARNSKEFISKFDKLENKILDYEFGSVSFLFNVIDKTKKDEVEINYSSENTNTEASENGSEEEIDINEGEMIARLILDMVSGNQQYSLVDNGIRIQPNYGDIAILSRSKTIFKTITNSLIKYNIPYKLHSGSGFYEAQEIVDVINYLRFIQNNNDDIAFVSLLKSTFFGLNDTDLFRISKTEGNSFWDKFQNYSKNIVDNSEEFQPILNAETVLINILDIALRVPLVHLLYKILNVSDWYGAIQRSNSAEQINANIRKLISFARSYDEKGFKNLFDFINDLEILADDTQEAEAAFITGENVVNMMTIHAAKGLEFPIVILANANNRGHYGDSYHINSEFGISFKYPVLNKKNIPELTSLHNFILAARVQNFSDIAEEKRILYVAMTRAKEHLVISSTIKKGKSGWGSLYKQLIMITDGMGFDLENYDGQEEKYSINIDNSIDVLYENEQVRLNFEFPVTFLNYENYIPEMIAQQNNKIPIPEILEVSIKPGTVESNISATKLLHYINDKDAFIQKYVLGLPSEDLLNSNLGLELTAHSLDNDEDVDDLLEDKADSKGIAAGNYIHNLLERITFWIDEDLEILNTNLKNEIEDLSKKLKTKFSEKLKKRLFDESINLCQTKLLKQFKSKLPNSRAEVSYHIPFDYDIISATFDLLIVNEKDEWEIWDWKSNQANFKEDLIYLGNHYEIQMKLYSYFNYLINPNQNKYIARLLFTRRAEIDGLDEYWTVKFEWNKADMDNFKEYLGKLLLEMKSLG